MNAEIRADQRPIVLMNEATLAVHPSVPDLRQDAHVVVAGPSRVRLALAPLQLPGTETIWADFRRSASLRSLRSRLEARGGIDRLILSEDRDDPHGGVANLSALLTLLPALRRSRLKGPQVILCYGDGLASRSMHIFLRGIAEKLKRDDLSVSWLPAR